MKTKLWVEFSGDVDEIVGRFKQERDAKVTWKLILINYYCSQIWRRSRIIVNWD